MTLRAVGQSHDPAHHHALPRSGGAASRWNPRTCAADSTTHQPYVPPGLGGAIEALDDPRAGGLHIERDGVRKAVGETKVQGPIGDRSIAAGRDIMDRELMVAAPYNLQ